MESVMDLKNYRKQIDSIDEQLLRLFGERMSVTQKIAGYKKEHGIPIFDPKREKEKLSSLNDPYEKKFVSALFELSRERQSEFSGRLYQSVDMTRAAARNILIINGPNLNMLGIREPELYGKKSYSDLVDFIRNVCSESGVQCECIQSNHEGEIIDAIQNARGRFDGIVINPAAFTHTSIAVSDALKAAGVPSVEVHLTDINNREDFRKVSYVSAVCEMTFSGLGFEGYAEAIRHFAKH